MTTLTEAELEQAALDWLACAFYLFIRGCFRNQVLVAAA